MGDEIRVTWDKPTQEKFQQIIGGIPDMIRGIAETRVSKKAETIVRAANRTEVTEKIRVEITLESALATVPLIPCHCPLGGVR